MSRSAVPAFRDLPIKRKLILITVLISSVALLLACVAFAIYEQNKSRRAMARDFAIVADIFDDNVASGLTFNDPASVEQTLKTLDANHHIVAAGVYDRAGKLVASFRRPDLPDFAFPKAQSGGQVFSDERLDTFRDIVLAGEKIGVVYIASDLEHLREQRWGYVATISGLLVICSLVALVLASRLQRLISLPIIQLAETAATVAVERNYAVRATKDGNDEVGRLIDAFNEMLAQIQKQDAELQAAREVLEHRVIERTKALKSSEERFSSAFENASIGMALVALEGRFLKVNHALCDITGYTPGELLERTCQEITHQDDVAPTDELSKSLVEGRIPSFQMERRYIHKQGHPVWVQLSVSLVRDAAGVPQHAIAQVQDVGKRKEAEAELARTHKQLLDASRREGMAEIATNVLHNVGNVLNSVNVSSSLLAETVRQSKAASLAKVVALLREHEQDLGAFLASDPRGQQIPVYLDQLADRIATEQAGLLREIGELQKNVDHIKEIVSVQQSYAKVSGLTEIVDLRDLVEDSLRMNVGGLSREGVDVVREYDAVPAVTVDKHKVLQILVNLVRNARHACDEAGHSEKKLRLKIAQYNGSVAISVIDNGVGIPAENLTRIFRHGFTTKKSGHGFGLHSGALAAKEMGGKLTVSSDGPGKGATFTLELPLQTREVAHA